jgi:hypothetical protein
MARALAITLLALTLALISSWPSRTAPDAHELPVPPIATTARR